MMKSQTFTWQNADGLQIFAQCWPAAITPLATVSLVHGYGEHCGRYKHVADKLTQAGFNVISFDHQGHGQSSGWRGHITTYDALLDDISRLLIEAQQRFPQTPQFLYGHSMGGNLVLNYALRRRPQLAGVVVTSPWLRLAKFPSAMTIRLGRLVSRVWPSFTSSSGLDNSALSRDPTVVQAYGSDLLNHNRISPRLFTQINGAGQWALDNASQFSLPLLLMHGTADRITSYEASHQFAGGISTGCTLKLWDNFYHEIHNEPEQDEVITFVVEWLRAHS